MLFLRCRSAGDKARGGDEFINGERVDVLFGLPQYPSKCQRYRRGVLGCQKLLLRTHGRTRETGNFLVDSR